MCFATPPWVLVYYLLRETIATSDDTDERRRRRQPRRRQHSLSLIFSIHLVKHSRCVERRPRPPRHGITSPQPRLQPLKGRVRRRRRLPLYSTFPSRSRTLHPVRASTHSRRRRRVHPYIVPIFPLSRTSPSPPPPPPSSRAQQAAAATVLSPWRTRAARRKRRRRRRCRLPPSQQQPTHTRLLSPTSSNTSHRIAAAHRPQPWATRCGP